MQRTLLSRPNLEQVIHLSDLDLSSLKKNSDSQHEELLQRLAQQVSIKPQTANLLTITYSNTNAVVAKNVVQALLTVFAESSTGSNRKDIENAKRFLDQQIQMYETQLRAAEQRKAEFHEKYIDLLPGLDGAVSRLEAGRAAVAKLQLDIADARAKRDALERELKSIPQFLEVNAGGPQVIVTGKQTDARSQLADAQAKLQQMKAQFTDQYPDVIALRRVIASLEAEVTKQGAAKTTSNGPKTQIGNPVYEKLKVSLVDAESAAASLQRRLRQAEERQAKLEKEAKETPGVQAQAQDLDRDYAVKKKNFEEFLERREQARIGEAADTTADKVQFRVVDPPQVPIIPTAPNKPMLFSGVFGAALIAAIAVPLLLLQFDRSYGTVTALRALGLPVAGTVSWLPSPDVRWRTRVQLGALFATLVVLLGAYGVLLAVSLNLYRLSTI
jgi:polysaccharide chain length determinant protein (PEP-CTERM system associated)